MTLSIAVVCADGKRQGFKVSLLTGQTQTLTANCLVK